MITIGNFFFKYRNVLFIFLYLLLFLPSPDVFTRERFGTDYHVWPIVLGLFITILGEAIRGATIGLAYIIRGGKDKKVFADKLVTEGIFKHCRNPLYVGNILMLLGVGILSNSVIYLCIVFPLFLFIYQSIVMAEENFLHNKFGFDFTNYCQRVNRWMINLKGINSTFSEMKFNYRRWLIKEYNTLFIWLVGIAALILFEYEHLVPDPDRRIVVFLIIFIGLGLIYGYVKYLKKSGKMTDQVG
jgi:protein-S-isoprenylcysteine O-methyltransferase Ste14